MTRETTATMAYRTALATAFCIKMSASVLFIKDIAVDFLVADCIGWRICWRWEFMLDVVASFEAFREHENVVDRWRCSPWNATFVFGKLAAVEANGKTLWRKHMIRIDVVSYCEHALIDGFVVKVDFLRFVEIVVIGKANPVMQ